MSDCGVCIGGNDYGGCDFHAAEIRKARKSHRCCECGEPIQPKDQYEHVSGKWEGELFAEKTCLSCKEIRSAFACNGSYLYECLWEDMRDYVFPELTTANKCLQKLSPANRARVIEKWQRWKGLTR